MERLNLKPLYPRSLPSGRDVEEAWYCSGTQRRYKRMLMSKGVWRETHSTLERLKREILNSIRDEKKLLHAMEELSVWKESNSESTQAAFQILGEILLFCVEEKNLSPLATLMEFGASVNQQVVDFFGYSEGFLTSTTAIHKAVEVGDPEMLARLLRDFGGDPNIQDRPDLNPPSMEAARFPRKLPVLKVLLDFGADPNVADRFGYTPLHLAVLQMFPPGDWEDVRLPEREEFFPIVELLLDRGARLTEVLCRAEAGPDDRHLLDNVVDAFESCEGLESRLNLINRLMLLLLEHGLDPDDWRRETDWHCTLLCVASFRPNSSCDLVSLLLNHGARVPLMLNRADVVFASNDVRDRTEGISDCDCVRCEKTVESLGSRLLKRAFESLIIHPDLNGESDVSCLCEATRSLMDVLLGSFSGSLQPRWSDIELRRMERMSERLSSSRASLQTRRCFSRLLEYVAEADRQPWSLRHWSRSSIRSALFHSKRRVTIEDVERLGLPEILSDFVLLRSRRRFFIDERCEAFSAHEACSRIGCN